MLRAGVAVVLLGAMVAASGSAPSAWAQGAKPLPGWGEPVDPAKDATIRLDGEALVIALPAAPRDLVPGGKLDAPRVERVNEGNFEAVVKVAADLAPAGLAAAGPGGDARSAGLLLWLDPRNFVRLERVARRDAGADAPRTALRFAYYRDGQPQPGSDELVDLPAAEPGAATWLRLTRRMAKLKAEHSADGATWTELRTIPIRLSSRLRLGVLATNTVPAPFEARFEAFKIKAIPLYPPTP